LAVVFKNQEISQQVVTRMQDLASEFSKIFLGWYPRTSQREGATSSRTQHPSRPLAGRVAQAPRCCDPNLGPPQLFSRGCAPEWTGQWLTPMNCRVSTLQPTANRCLLVRLRAVERWPLFSWPCPLQILRRRWWLIQSRVQSLMSFSGVFLFLLCYLELLCPLNCVFFSPVRNCSTLIFLRVLCYLNFQSRQAYTIVDLVISSRNSQYSIFSVTPHFEASVCFCSALLWTIHHSLSCTLNSRTFVCGVFFHILDQVRV